MLKVYGSLMCGDCVAAKANLDAQKAEYEFVDVFSSIALMKEFLALRDHEEAFTSAKEAGSIGIPAFVDEEGITTDWEGWLKGHGYEVYSTSAGACSLDHKGGC